MWQAALGRVGDTGASKSPLQGRAARHQRKELRMADKKVWLITGASRGLGLDIAKAAHRAGHAVIATGRNPAKVTAAIGHYDDLLAIKLDITRLEDAQDAVAAAIGKFGRIDVLINNAGNFYAGFFEELSPVQVRDQIETLLFGPMNVTRAVLPVMRKQRAGLVVTISSTAGISGLSFCSAYAAAKFGVEGWMESLTPEIAPFGIHTMLVEPGFFRTELLSNSSTTYAKPNIDDYAKQTREIIAAWTSMDGKQGGDPAKLADALVHLAGLREPPARFAAGADAVQTLETKANALLIHANAFRELSSSLAH
jgi:NAD(P)-dependent dehydrogenase (short-subunit alcohol dehydrogenase family)